MGSFGTLATCRYFEVDSLSISQVVVGCVYIGDLYIDIASSVVRRNEPETFVFIEPFDCSFHLFPLLRP